MKLKCILQLGGWLIAVQRCTGCAVCVRACACQCMSARAFGWPKKRALIDKDTWNLFVYGNWMHYLLALPSRNLRSKVHVKCAVYVCVCAKESECENGYNLLVQWLSWSVNATTSISFGRETIKNWTENKKAENFVVRSFAFTEQMWILLHSIAYRVTFNGHFDSDCLYLVAVWRVCAHCTQIM